MDEEMIRKAMEAMHWRSSSVMPMANNENQSILEVIKSLKEKKEELLEHQQSTEERLQKLHQHTTNSEETINHNLKLLDAFQSEVRSEAHLYKLAIREHCKLNEDLRNVGKEWRNFKKYNETTEKEMCKRKKNIDSLTSRIKWAKTALIEWRQAMDDGNKGYQLIEMYCKDDQLQAKQQNQKRQKLNEEIERKRKKLIEMNNEQKTLENALECIANLYRTAHAERRQMVETWKSAAQQMTQREKDIRNTEMALIDCRRRADLKAKELKANDNKLNDIVQNNREVEEAIEVLNVETSDVKEQIQKISDMVILKTQEVELISKELQNLASRVQQQRAENRRFSKEKSNILIELERSEIVIKKLEDRYSKMGNKNMSAQQRLQSLEELMEIEDKSQKEVARETNRINGLMFRSQQQLSKFKEESTSLLIYNRGIISNMSAIAKNMESVEKDISKETENNYETAYKSLQLERRLIHLQGGIIDPEAERRNQDYLNDLEDRNAQLLKSMQATQLQNKKLDDDMRKLTSIYNNDMKQLDLVTFKIKESQVYCEGGLKRTKEETRRNQELIVELSILKMRAHEFESEINQCDEGTYNLFKHRMHLDRTIKDRLVEIKSQMDVLNLKRKHLMEELSTLRADVGERRKKIDAVKARFELTSKLLGKNEDGSLITATQLRVETAQEKQMLLDEGNDLNEQVLKAEKEIEALQNTLALLNNCNDAYRKEMQELQEGEQAIAELKSLQVNYCASLNTLRSLRQELQDFQKKTDESLQQKEDLEKLLCKETEKRAANADLLSRLQKELLDQKTKLTRAERELKIALKAIKQRAISSEFLEIYERDLDLRDLEKRNLNVLNQLGDVAYTDELLGPKIARNVLNRGLKMPHMLQKSRSSFSWQSDTSYDAMSLSSSKELFTSRSSQSDVSDVKLTQSRLSVISLELPAKKKGGK